MIYLWQVRLTLVFRVDGLVIILNNLTLYVDDILPTGKDVEAIVGAKRMLVEGFAVANMGSTNILRVDRK